MDNKEAIAAWRARREKRLAARPMAHKDTETEEGTWVTIKGTPVLIDDKGNIKNNFRDKGAQARLGGENMKDVDTGKQKKPVDKSNSTGSSQAKAISSNFEAKDKGGKALGEFISRCMQEKGNVFGKEAIEFGKKMEKIMPKNRVLYLPGQGHYHNTPHDGLMNAEEIGLDIIRYLERSNNDWSKIVYYEEPEKNTVSVINQFGFPFKETFWVKDYMEWRNESDNTPDTSGGKKRKKKNAQEAAKRLKEHIEFESKRAKPGMLFYVNGKYIPYTQKNSGKIYKEVKSYLDSAEYLGKDFAPDMAIGMNKEDIQNSDAHKTAMIHKSWYESLR